MFELSIVTAEGLIYQGEIEMLVAATVNGEIGILTNHHPLVTKLGPGAMRAVKKGGEEQLLFVNGGYLEVINNKVTVLADVAENMDALEVEQARAAREKAQEALAQARAGAHAGALTSRELGEIEMAKLEEELRAQMVRERLAEVNKFKKKIR